MVNILVRKREREEKSGKETHTVLIEAAGCGLEYQHKGSLVIYSS